jgi:DNA-binding MarR family transcriptional regulator
VPEIGTESAPLQQVGGERWNRRLVVVGRVQRAAIHFAIKHVHSFTRRLAVGTVIRADHNHFPTDQPSTHQGDLHARCAGANLTGPADLVLGQEISSHNGWVNSKKQKSTERTDDLHDLSNRPGFLLRKAHQVAVAIFSEEVGQIALTPPQHNVMSALMVNPGSHQTDIGRIVGYDRATVGAVLAGLEARQLVERRESDNDKRSKALTLTRTGKKLLNKSNEAMERINLRILEPLAVHEQPLFIALLARIAFSRQPLKRAPPP